MGRRLSCCENCLDGGPLGSDAVLVVPRLWGCSCIIGGSSRTSYLSLGRAFSMFNFAGVGFGPFRTDAPRLIGAGALSASGGGVGGNMLRPIGGSDC